MKQRSLGFAACLFLGLLMATPVRSDDYVIDTAHAGVNFKLSHLGLSWVQGRFNEFAGTFTIDPQDPSKCVFSLTIEAKSIDTNNQKRDGHLRGPDFFNVKQFQAINFRSTTVQALKEGGGYQVTGNFTMHGITKPITFALLGGLRKEFPKGVQRTGFSTEMIIKRSDFGMDKFGDSIGDNVHISISFEGVKK